MRKVRKIILCIVYFLYTVKVFAQYQGSIQNQYKFNSINIEQGLSNNKIISICQDAKGFIWFGTGNGLDKFNGQNIVSYRNVLNDSTSLSSNKINIIFLDSKNNLWVGGDGGIDRYIPDYDNFERFTHKDITWPIMEVYSIVEDKNGEIWFAGNTGLYGYQPKTNKLRFFGNKKDFSYGVLPHLPFELLNDEDDKLWISVLNEGLYVYDKEKDSFKVYKNEPEVENSISGNRIEKLYKDRKGNIWAGTLNNGLNLFDAQTNSFKRFLPDSDNNYSWRVRAIFEDFNDDFFIGTRAGLYVWDDYAKSFFHYAFEGHAFSNLSQNSILESFIDNTGTLWIGTFSGGVNYTNLNKKEFVHYIAGNNDNHYLNGSNIYSFVEGKDGGLWIGGDNGLNYLDKKSHSFKYFTHEDDNPNSLSYNDVKALELDKKGNLWIGTNRGGLNYLDVKTGKFKIFKHDPNDSGSIIGDKIYGLLNDKYNNLWIIIGVRSEFDEFEIDLLLDGHDEFIHLKEKAYFGFDQDKEGNVYIGARNGFWIYNRKDSVFNLFENSEFKEKQIL